MCICSKAQPRKRDSEEHIKASRLPILFLAELPDPISHTSDKWCISPPQLSSSSLQLWHHQYLLCPPTWLAQLPQINVPGFALVTQHAGPAFLRNASVPVVFLDLLIWLTCTADLFLLHSKPCFCLHIGAVWPLTLTRELLVIYWVDQRASGKYRPTYSSLHTGVGVKFSWNIGMVMCARTKRILSRSVQISPHYSLTLSVT